MKTILDKYNRLYIYFFRLGREIFSLLNCICSLLHSSVNTYFTILHHYNIIIIYSILVIGTLDYWFKYYIIHQTEIKFKNNKIEVII